MKKIKYIISIIVVTLTIGYTIVIGDFNVLNLRNDSGFDTSYGGDGGYSSSSSSSYGSSSSSSSGNYFVNPEATAIILLILVSIIILVISVISWSNKKSSKKSTIKELTEDEIKKIIPDFNLQQFLNDRLNDFIEIQLAWQDFNYDKLREKLTDSLYNQYVMQLDTLKVKNQRNVMSDFEMRDHIITNVKEENGKYIVEVGLLISFKDYIEENGKVVRGDKDATIVQKYKLKYICSKEEQFEYCPNCGAKLTNAASQTCDYCRTTISRVSTQWVLSEKKSLEQNTLY